MTQSHLANEHPPSIHQLYPGLTPEERNEAEERLKEYLEIVVGIYERVVADPEAYAKFRRTLTDFERYVTIGTQRSKTS